MVWPHGRARVSRVSIAAGEQRCHSCWLPRKSGESWRRTKEKGIFKRLWPIGLAVMKRYFSVGRGMWANHHGRTASWRERRGRAGLLLAVRHVRGAPYLRPPPPPGIFHWTRVNLPSGATRTSAGVDAPVRRRAPLQRKFGLVRTALRPRCRGECLWRWERRPGHEDFYARGRAPEEPEGEGPGRECCWQTGPDAQGGGGQAQSQDGHGQKCSRSRKPWWKTNYHRDAKRRTPEALAALLVEPEAARARRQRAHVREVAPRAQQVRRLASLGRTGP